MADEAGTTASPAPTDGAAPPAPDAEKSATDELGDGGKKALDAERRDKRAAEKRANELEARLKEFEDRDKTESERAAERIAKADAEVATVPAKVAEALKAHLVELHEISDEDAELFLTATEPELLLKQVSRLQERNADAGRPRAPRPDPTQGRAPSGTPLDPRSADLAQIEADLRAGKSR